MNVRDTVSWLKKIMQEELFPQFQESLSEPLNDKQKKLISVLEILEIEKYVRPSSFQWMGRKLKDRRAIARAFVAKNVYNMETTRELITALHERSNLRRICGFGKNAYIMVKEPIKKDGKYELVEKQKSVLPSESTFSRAFDKFAESELGDMVHKALVKEYLPKDMIIGHISRDATAIEGNEKPAKKTTVESKSEKIEIKRGKPKKGEQREEKKEEKRLAKQVEQSASDALEEIPIVCDVGCKQNAKGYKETWRGYKLHLDTTDNCLPVTAILTSASVHDSQVAIPMMKMTSASTTYLYDLMDSAYDAKEIYKVSRSLNHVPIIDRNPRRGDAIPMSPAEAVRYNERTVAERANGRLKEEFGCRKVKVRGHKKVRLHLLFGVITLFADQLLRLAI